MSAYSDGVRARREGKALGQCPHHSFYTGGVSGVNRCPRDPWYIGWHAEDQRQRESNQCRCRVSWDSQGKKITVMADCPQHGITPAVAPTAPEPQDAGNTTKGDVE